MIYALITTYCPNCGRTADFGDGHPVSSERLAHNIARHLSDTICPDCPEGVASRRDVRIRWGKRDDEYHRADGTHEVDCSRCGWRHSPTVCPEPITNPLEID